MKKPVVICVRHRSGWCATKRKKDMTYRDSVPTLCNFYVTLPFGIEKRVPDCSECLEILASSNK